MLTTFDQKLAEWFQNELTINDWPVGNLLLVVIAILLSVLLCGAIGIEREWRGRSAGLRTHMLVGVGSCVIMIISIYGFPYIKIGEEYLNRDVARLAAQVVTGVGFLGAGAIIHKNDSIKGLTTAGTIWIVMAIGIACGSFNFIIAILTTLVVILVLIIFRKVEAKMNKRKIIFSITAPADMPVLEKILTVSTQYACTSSTLSNDLITHDGANMIRLVIQVVFEKEDVDFSEFVAALTKETGAVDIHTLNNHR
ncbi:MAG: MgtC/SapB family protein [Bacilli bacterium]|nr:MgtC/SapB family protein [Bacilli bacterium]